MGYIDESSYGTSADWAFWLKLASSGHGLALVPLVLSQYLVDPSSHNRTNDKDGRKENRIPLDPGVAQRPHRHNSVAVSLVVQGDGCFSKIDGRRKDWSPWATTITPPVSIHSHHNEGQKRAFFLIVQDGGFFYHARAMGFEFADA